MLCLKWKEEKIIILYLQCRTITIMLQSSHSLYTFYNYIISPITQYNFVSNRDTLTNGLLIYPHTINHSGVEWMSHNIDFPLKEQILLQINKWVVICYHVIRNTNHVIPIASQVTFSFITDCRWLQNEGHVTSQLMHEEMILTLAGAIWHNALVAIHYS